MKERVESDTREPTVREGEEEAAGDADGDDITQMGMGIAVKLRNSS